MLPTYKEDYMITIKKIAALVFLAVGAATIDARPVTKRVVTFAFQHVMATQQKGTMLKKIAQLFSRQQWSELPMSMKVLTVCLYRYMTHKVSLKQLMDENPYLLKYKDDIYNLITLDVPKQDMLDLLKKLKDDGVILILATSKSQEVIELLKTMYPELFAPFDVLYYGPDNQGHKPDNEFFVGLRKIVNQLADITIKEEYVYVDAHKKNCEAAQHADYNVRTITFQSAQKLEENLRAWGYFSDEQAIA